MKNNCTVAKDNCQVNTMDNISSTSFFNVAVRLFLFVFITILFLANNKAQESSQRQPPSNTASQRKTTHLAGNDIPTKLNLADSNRRTNPKLFKQLLTELALQQNHFSTEQKHYFNLLQSYSLTFTGQYDKAEAYLKIILQSNASELIKFRANYTLINITTAKKNWSEGLQYVAINIKSLPTINNNKHYQNGLITTIVFYIQLKQYNLALSYIKQLAKQKLTAQNNCVLKQLTLEAKFNLKQLEANNIVINEAIQTCQQADYKAVTNIIRLYQAKLFLAEQNPDKALTLLLSYVEEVNSTRYPMLIAGFNNTLAKAYWQLNDMDNALTYVNKAQLANKGLTNVQQGVDTYHLLFQITKQQGNFELALQYHQKYAELDKANLDETQAKHLVFQLAEHKSLEQKSQIALLNKKNDLLTTEQALIHANAENTHLIIMVLVLTLSVLTFWGYRLLIAHKRIKELAGYDALTGIYNRGHFTQVANNALKYCQSAEQALSVIMFDLDHFKNVNDSYGHACGDWALKKVAEVCKSISRKNDVFARLGGEEFCILLTSCDSKAAQLRAEACRKAIAEIVSTDSGFDFIITASFGVTDVKTSGYELDKLLADADSAAYAAKHAGRNQVIVFQPKTTAEPTVALDNSQNTL